MRKKNRELRVERLPVRELLAADLGGAWNPSDEAAMELAQPAEGESVGNYTPNPATDKYQSVEWTIDGSVRHQIQRDEAILEIVNRRRQNFLDATDTNFDGYTSPLDVLNVIIELNRRGQPETVPPLLLNDVSGDGFVSPIDALLVIERLNNETTVREESPVAYSSFDGSNYDLYAYEGRNVRLLADRADLPLDGLIQWIDFGYDAYFEATKRHPNNTEQSQGKTVIARVPTCGAGCGYLGFRGIEVAPQFFDEAVEEFERSGRPDHIFFYELGRNFWFYGDQLEFNHGREDQTSRGSGDFFVNGFPIFMERAIQEFLGVDYSGAGAGVEGFEETNARWLAAYLADPSRDYYTDFADFEHSVHTDSLTNIRIGTMDFFAEIMMDLARDYDGMEFVNRLWNQVAQRNHWHDEVSALGNLISSASMAAGEDLTARFRDVYKWPVVEEAMLFNAATSAGYAEFEGTGLTGVYIREFDHRNPDQSVVNDPTNVIRTDETVNFDWGLGTPIESFPSDGFAAWWEGKIFIPAPGTYEFSIFADDGVKLTIGGQVVINAFQPQRTEVSGTITFDPEDVGPHSILLDYFEDGGAATVQLSWEHLYFGGIVPSDYLQPAAWAV